VQVEGSTPEALAAVIEEDLRTWRQFIPENGLAPE
jgi:tripartite-type tricarboxylate transporter receptor subunit TctC